MEKSKQYLANLIQSYEQIVLISRQLYADLNLKDWAQTEHSFSAQQKIADVKKILMDEFSINYDSPDAKDKLIKEVSEVEVLVNHMDGMAGGSAVVKRYSIPAMLSDIVMKDGMKMSSHKWLTNDEVKLK